MAKVKRQQAADERYYISKENFFDDEAKDAVKAAFDELFTGPEGRNNMMSMAVDHFDMDPKEAQDLLNTIEENGGSALESWLDDKLIDRADKLHIGSKIEKREALSLEEELKLRSNQQVQTQRRLAELGGLKTTDYDKKTEAEKFRIEQDIKLLDNALKPNDKGELPNLAGLIGKGNIQNVEYDSNWGEGGEMEITLKGQDKPLKFEVDANGNLTPDAQQLLFTQLNLGTVPTKGSETKK